MEKFKIAVNTVVISRNKVMMVVGSMPQVVVEAKSNIFEANQAAPFQ